MLIKSGWNVSLDNFKSRLNSKEASQLQKRLLILLKKKIHLKKIMDKNKDIIIQWYMIGKKGNEFHHFHNQLTAHFITIDNRRHDNIKRIH